MKTPPFLQQTSNNRLNYIVGLCIIIAFIFNFLTTHTHNLYGPDPINTFGYSEYLINFHGGFVRRGLLGEILYRIYSIYPFPILPVITAISYIAFGVVLIFFLYQFHKNGYCWWIIFSSIFLGVTTFIIRKDFILYLIIIGYLYLLRDTSSSLYKRLLACVLCLFGLLLHEAFVFFGFAMYALLLFNNKHNRPVNYMLIILPIILFFILCRFNGSADVASSIVNSWNSILPSAPLKLNYCHPLGATNSIGALGWDAKSTFLWHIETNADIKDGGIGIIMLPVSIISTYYMIINFLPVFNPKLISRNVRLTISLIYSCILLSLLPMFTILSCDMVRVFQYATITTFATFIIIPQNTIEAAFPMWYKRIIEKFNNHLNHFLPPSQGLMILMLLFLGMAPSGFSLQSCWWNSIVGNLFQFIIYIKAWLVHLFL